MATTLADSAVASGTVYATNTSSDSVAQLSIGGGGELTALTPPTVSAGSYPMRMSVTPDGRSVYAVNREEDTVSQYSVDPHTGALTPKTPASVPAGWEPFAVAVHPDGTSAYVPNYQDNTVSQYDVDRVSSVLVPKTPAVVDTGTLPSDVVIAPDGKSAYVTNVIDHTVSQYDVHPETGALSPKAPPEASGRWPFFMAISPDGKSVYTANGADDTISQYDVDPETGTLSPKTPAQIAAPDPGLIGISPDGKSAYVPSQIDDFVSQYDIDAATGVLSPKSPATVAAGNAPYGVAISPDGRHAYVTNAFSNSISQYDIDSLSGRFTPKTPATVATGGLYPHGIAVAPLPQAYVRPRSATPLRAALVPAYQPCTNPNLSHAEPLAYASCAPPASGSSILTVGTPDANGKPAAAVGSMRLDVCRDTLCASGDVSIKASITDVRVTAGLGDYAGELQGVLPLRITDNNNGTSGEGGIDPATVSDTQLTFVLPCVPTPDASPGSTCNVSTTANSIVPAAVQEGLRTIWELGRLEVYDGGPDGTASTGPNAPFVRQGIFVP